MGTVLGFRASCIQGTSMPVWRLPKWDAASSVSQKRAPRDIITTEYRTMNGLRNIDNRMIEKRRLLGRSWALRMEVIDSADADQIETPDRH